VCIVGSGFAGITLANELNRTGLKVVVLEAGGMRRDKADQDLYRGKVVSPQHHGELHVYRERRFGGTSHVWGGRCAPFDAIDFARREHVPYSGWPIGRAELDAYYRRAFQYCDLGRFATDVEQLLPDAARPIVPGFSSANVRTDRPWLFSRPTNFARKFKRALASSSNVHVFLYASCVNISTTNSEAAVDYLEASSPRKNRFSVKARHYVLAMGGLEVTRLLLASRNGDRVGFSNCNANIGKYYISHITGTVGKIAFNRHPIIWGYERTFDGVYSRRTFRIDEHAQLEHKLLNFRGGLEFGEIGDPRHGQAILSAVYLLKRFLLRRIPPEYSANLSAVQRYDHVGQHVWNCVKGSPSLFPFAGTMIRKRLLASRKLPSVLLENKSHIYQLHIDAEQAPNPASRVHLDSERDTLGLLRLVADWSCSARDVDSVLASVNLIIRDLERTGTGVSLSHNEEMRRQICRSAVGSHHIGLTRMATSPGEGVVDRDCTVFGLANLQIASSSTFPTSSFANPTLTIVAMAIRIADSIKTAAGGR
jgi:choline dehydrogenase-like flavoprotein